VSSVACSKLYAMGTSGLCMRSSARGSGAGGAMMSHFFSSVSTKFQSHALLDTHNSEDSGRSDGV
jgi:hypothetical protein